MPMCLTKTICKEVVIPDKNGNPIGGLTCKDICNHLGVPPGWKEWTAVAGEYDLTAAMPLPRDRLRVMDMNTGVVIELTRAEARFITRAARERWGPL